MYKASQLDLQAVVSPSPKPKPQAEETPQTPIIKEASAKSNMAESALKAALSDEERAELVRTFALLQAEQSRNGLRVWINFLMENPNQKKLFRNFRYLTDGEMGNSDELRRYGCAVMQELGEIIAAMEDGKTLAEIFKKFSLRHKKAKVHRAYMEKITPCFLDLLAGMESPQTELTKTAWDKLIRHISHQI